MATTMMKSLFRNNSSSSNKKNDTSSTTFGRRRSRKGTEATYNIDHEVFEEQQLHGRASARQLRTNRRTGGFEIAAGGEAAAAGAADSGDSDASVGERDEEDTIADHSLYTYENNNIHSTTPTLAPPPQQRKTRIPTVDLDDEQDKEPLSSAFTKMMELPASFMSSSKNKSSNNEKDNNDNNNKKSHHRRDHSNGSYITALSNATTVKQGTTGKSSSKQSSSTSSSSVQLEAQQQTSWLNHHDQKSHPPTIAETKSGCGSFDSADTSDTKKKKQQGGGGFAAFSSAFRSPYPRRKAQQQSTKQTTTTPSTVATSSSPQTPSSTASISLQPTSSTTLSYRFSVDSSELAASQSQPRRPHHAFRRGRSLRSISFSDDEDGIGFEVGDDDDDDNQQLMEHQIITITKVKGGNKSDGGNHHHDTTSVCSSLDEDTTSHTDDENDDDVESISLVYNMSDRDLIERSPSPGAIRLTEEGLKCHTRKAFRESMQCLQTENSSSRRSKRGSLVSTIAPVHVPSTKNNKRGSTTTRTNAVVDLDEALDAHIVAQKSKLESTGSSVVDDDNELDDSLAPESEAQVAAFDFETWQHANERRKWIRQERAAKQQSLTDVASGMLQRQEQQQRRRSQDAAFAKENKDDKASSRKQHQHGNNNNNKSHRKNKTWSIAKSVPPIFRRPEQEEGVADMSLVPLDMLQQNLQELPHVALMTTRRTSSSYPQHRRQSSRSNANSNGNKNNSNSSSSWRLPSRLFKRHSDVSGQSHLTETARALLEKERHDAWETQLKKDFIEHQEKERIERKRQFFLEQQRQRESLAVTSQNTLFKATRTSSGRPNDYNRSWNTTSSKSTATMTTSTSMSSGSQLFKIKTLDSTDEPDNDNNDRNCVSPFPEDEVLVDNTKQNHTTDVSTLSGGFSHGGGHGGGGGNGNLVAMPLCAVCFGATPTHIATPCMHFRFCKTCVDELKNESKSKQASSNCPVCLEPNVQFAAVSL